MDKPTDEQKCAEEIQAVLAKYDCEFAVAMIVTIQGNTFQVQVVKKAQPKIIRPETALVEPTKES